MIGQQLVPALVAAGHEVTALARSRARAAGAERAGARLVLADALDPGQLAAAVRAAAPEAVVHLLTAIPQQLNPRHLARDFALTNRLRTEGTRNLIEAARAAGARRLVAQSVAFAYRPGVEPVVDEDAPLWLEGAPRQFTPVVAALAELERRTLDAGGTVLRFGTLYGPGTALGRGGALTEQVRRGRFPIVGAGSGVFSFTATRDAAGAVLAALDAEGPDVLNVVDDDPAPVSEWLPALARVLGAPPPRRVPTWLARPLLGGFGVALLTQLAGASNARARKRLGWVPHYPSWREGFPAELA